VHAAVALMDQKWELDVTIQDKILTAMGDAELASLRVMQLMDQMVLEKHPHMVKAA
jgi:hypothetical protein